jgi:hypothetical protein
MVLDSEDREDLFMFRQAARQVRDASVIAEGKQVHMSGRRSATGEMVITTTLLESEAFRSLAMAIRLVYQANEPANFGHICNILWRSGDDEIKARTAELREQYNDALSKHHPLIAAVALREKASYSPRDIFESWLYFGAFHQDRRRRADFNDLSRLGDAFPLAVQATALRLAGRILDLDDLVADLLGEDKLERIAPRSNDDQADA